MVGMWNNGIGERNFDRWHILCVQYWFMWLWSMVRLLVRQYILKNFKLCIMLKLRPGATFTLGTMQQWYIINNTEGAVWRDIAAMFTLDVMWYVVTQLHGFPGNNLSRSFSNHFPELGWENGCRNNFWWPFYVPRYHTWCKWLFISMQPIWSISVSSLPYHV